MKPASKSIRLATALSLATVLVACGGGGSTDIAGIGGSGIVSSGTITGFGSVFVNGVKFETSRSTFDIEGNLGTQDDLAIGMVVKVNGTINPDGVTGTATSIIFDDDLQGPVANYALSADRLSATFTIMEINVQIDSKTTYFDPDNDGIAIDTIKNGNIVELSGFFDGNGTLIASRIESKTGSGDENVELKGTITNLGDSSFKLRNITVEFNNDTLKDLPNGLANQMQVEVKGRFSDSRIIATEIESEAFEYDDLSQFEVEGFITNFSDSNNQFTVNGITVKFNSTTPRNPSMMQLANNLQIEVEGQLINGVLIATEIKLRGGEVEISAPITDIDIANKRFEIEPVSGQPIIIQTGTETQFENDLQYGYSVQITDLKDGDFVEVEGYQNNANNERSLFASEVKITDSDPSDPEEIEVQGFVSSMTLSTITIMGISFDTTAAPSFESDDSNIASLDDLRDKVNAGERILVKVELSNNTTNVITSIEIED